MPGPSRRPSRRFRPSAPQAAPRRAPPAGPRTGLRETLRRLAARKTALDAEIVPGVGPAAIPDGARYEAGSFHDVHGARDYRLYVPAAPAPSSEGRPLLVMLHGCTQTPDDFARGTRMNAAAEEAGCVVLYPAQPSSANPNRCWNWFRPEDQRRDAGEPALIAGMVRSVIAAKHVDPGRVYVAGLSAGGAAAAVLGTEYPDVFAAVGVHSGLPHGAARDIGSALAAMRQGARSRTTARPVRMIVFHGDADRTVSPANAEALAAQAAMGAPDPKVKLDAGDVERPRLQPDADRGRGTRTGRELDAFRRRARLVGRRRVRQPHRRARSRRQPRDAALLPAGLTQPHCPWLPGA